MSPDSREGRRSAIDWSTTAAGTMSHTARGLLSFFTKSASDDAPVACSCTSCFTASGDRSKTTQSWPPLSSRRTMFAPIRPRPIIPSCMLSLLVRFELSDAIASILRAARGRPQEFRGYGHAFVVTEDRRTRHKHGGAGFDDEWGGLRVDAPVHLELASGLQALDHLPD